MNEQSAQAIVTIASIAAMADGSHDAQERQQIADVATQLGVPHDEIVLSETDSAAMAAAQVARRLDSDEARAAAYEVALAVCVRRTGTRTPRRRCSCAVSRSHSA